MATLARGQITLVDLNDAKSVSAYLGVNHSLTQIYNKENSSYVPNYAATGQALVITPEVFVSGSATSAINQLRGVPTYKINGRSTLADFGATMGSTAPYALTINRNLTNVAQLHIEMEGIYVDPSTSIQTPFKASVTITKTENAGQLIAARAYTPNGSIFRQGGPATLTARCEMIRGSQVDATNVAYQWHKLLPNGTYEALTSSKSHGCSGYTTDTLSVPASAVLNFETFRCDVKDTDASSGTHNTIVSGYVQFVDMTDPYFVEVVAPDGDTFGYGITKRPLVARVLQAGKEIDEAGAMFVYNWTLKNKSGQLVSGWTRTGKRIEVNRSDFTGMCTIGCNLDSK